MLHDGYILKPQRRDRVPPWPIPRTVDTDTRKLLVPKLKNLRATPLGNEAMHACGLRLVSWYGGIRGQRDN